MNQVNSPYKTEALIAFADLTNFAKLAKGKEPSEIFEILMNMARITTEIIGQSGGQVIKYIGDSVLITFPCDRVDDGITSLISLKEGIDSFFKGEDLPNRIAISVHWGPVIFGKLPPFETPDVFGDVVNIAATLNRGVYHGGFIISTQAFRKLSPGIRKMFSKFTPPVVYRLK